MGPLLRVILLLALAAPALSGAEVAVLRNGFRLRADHHEARGETSRVFLASGGWVDLNAADIDRFEPEDPVPAPARPAAQRVQETDPVLASAARHGLDPDIIRSIIRAESAGNPQAVSPKGAQGLMQLMPGTARRLGVDNVFDPAQNVEGGTSYFRQLLARFDNDLALALAAYNAGPEKVVLHRGIPPYMETRAYVGRGIRRSNQGRNPEKQRSTPPGRLGRGAGHDFLDRADQVGQQIRFAEHRNLRAIEESIETGREHVAGYN